MTSLSRLSILCLAALALLGACGKRAPLRPPSSEGPVSEDRAEPEAFDPFSADFPALPSEELPAADEPAIADDVDAAIDVDTDEDVEFADEQLPDPGYK